MREIEKKVNKALLELLSKALFGGKLSFELNKEEFSELFLESKIQTVLGIAFDVLPGGYEKVSPEIYAKWQAVAFNVISNSMNISFANDQLTKLLEESGIKHCTLKGAASAQYYPKPYLRQMGDIDFLVDKKDRERALELLLKNGFKDLEQEHYFHVELVKNKVIYELHTQIGSVPQGKEFAFEFTSKIIPEAIRKSINNTEFYSPDTFCHGMIILLHMQRHIEMCEGIGLRHLCDWAVFVNSLSNTEFAEIFEPYMKSIGLWRFAQIMSQVCHIYLNMPVKEWMGTADKKLCADVMEDVLQSGNFGQKDESRGESSVFVDKESAGRSTVGTFFHSVTRMVCGWRPMFEKHKILLPAGYVGYFFHCIGVVLTGKRKLNVADMSQKGIQRNNTYKQLKFFDVESKK